MTKTAGTDPLGLVHGVAPDACQATSPVITPFPRADCNESGTFLLSLDPSVDALVEIPRRFDAAWQLRRADRCFDLLVGLLLLLAFLPLLGLCTVAVWASGPGPVLFRQSRIGHRGRMFECLKFRTMSVGAEYDIDAYLKGSARLRQEWNSLQKLHNDPRVTPLGQIMRRYCLDELPQLLNVIAGDMSVVGPRPIVSAESSKYGNHFADYCSVKPGLTGLWQVSGRHAVSYEERVLMDAQYARTKCVRADIAIIARTIPVVLLGQNE